VATWAPGDAWPSGEPGGASPPAWGGYVRLWLRAGLAPGRAFRMGADPQDRLDAGNVMGGGGSVAARDVSGERLWIDLTCDALELAIEGGASSTQGIFSKADASTLTVTLRDPEGDYDPLNADSPYAYGGHSRLVPGTPVECYAEVVDPSDGSWERFWIFTGTSDSWGEDWTPNPGERVAVMVATDITKRFVAWNRPEQPPVGAGDTTRQRIARIVAFYGWEGTVIDPPGPDAVTLAPTTLAQGGWELLNRTTDDEIGFVWFDPEGRLRWANRATWETLTVPAATFGCEHVDGAALDVLVDASPSNLDGQMRNAVFASRSGGTMQTARSESSIERFGQWDFKRTDLGVETDGLAGAWAEYVAVLYAYPQVALADVTAVPAVSARSWDAWAAVLGLTLIVDLVRIVWAPPDRPTSVIDTVSRVVGFSHKITAARWEWTPQLIAANALMFSGSVFTMGPHPADLLDSGFVLGFTSTADGSF